ncbi:tRNA (guanosine(46)-N7)-methyltransferase TrmB [Dankookia rubra]|uniref:tRNA (guanine-N(7)-)-methyltransferase n=1 Tax=Dankookia rubra TaxID=1442381 RepID=A0A4R5QA50_9PROT|nr:tRNA (guanine(46)-N(7))-methyltransferase TrmB [Dankookia rubra]TDH59636.1 tRNA (guanosine(46)-N7)-methyltransferase TrmB [Dankookia rubra]
MTADRPPLAEGVPDRLYGRRRSHPLRARQQQLLDETLPRLRLDPARVADPRAAFGMPVEALWMEVGFGGGEHALAHVERNPRAGYIASEVFENGLCSLLSRLVAEREEATGALPPNLRLWPQDARHLLGLLPPASLDRLFLMFPDPWPKARHAKRRFVNPTLLPLVARALRPGGEWRIASDDPTYQAWVAEVMAAQDLFAVPPPAEARPEGWPPTRYEAKALREGRRPLYWSLIRRAG